MKKFVSTLLVAILFVGASFTLSVDAAGTAKTGIYSITTGAEAYYTTAEFKALPKAKKVELFRGQWYIVAGPTVYPIQALISSNADIAKSKTSVTDFETKNNVDLADIAAGVVDEDFGVVGID